MFLLCYSTTILYYLILIVQKSENFRKKALINSFINKEKLDDNFSINASDYLLDVGDKINSWFNKHNCDCV